MKIELTTQAGNIDFWRKVKEELDIHLRPNFLCIYSSTFNTSWKKSIDTDSEFVEEIKNLGSLFLTDCNFSDEVIINKEIVITNDQLFRFTKPSYMHSINVSHAEIRTKFVEWVINYLKSNQNQ
jgi:hypothetical protein